MYYKQHGKVYIKRVDLNFETHSGHKQLKIVFSNLNLRALIYGVWHSIHTWISKSFNAAGLQCESMSSWGNVLEQCGLVLLCLPTWLHGKDLSRYVALKKKNKYIWMWVCVFSSQPEQSIELRGVCQPNIRNGILLLWQQLPTMWVWWIGCQKQYGPQIKHFKTE